VRNGHTDVVKRLLERGANVNDVGPDGTSALNMAVVNAFYEVAATLLDQGADPNLPDARASPLHTLAWLRKPGSTGDAGVGVLPQLPRDAGDRNRTSPFAFTGNKFEFRAVSSNQSIGYPNVALNVAVTESLDYIAGELEKAMKGGASVQAAAKALLPKLVKENKRILFNGNGYSKEWEREAAKRGLLNLKNTVDALPQVVTKESVALFEKYKVLNSREVHARYEIMVETYNKTMNVEGQLLALMVQSP